MLSLYLTNLFHQNARHLHCIIVYTIVLVPYFYGSQLMLGLYDETLHAALVNLLLKHMHLLSASGRPRPGEKRGVLS
jgi:hypothetical protein